MESQYYWRRYCRRHHGRPSGVITARADGTPLSPRRRYFHGLWGNPARSRRAWYGRGERRLRYFVPLELGPLELGPLELGPLELHHGFVAKGNAVAGDNRAAKWKAGHRNHFDVRNGQRNTNNGDCLPCCGNNVANRKPQARDQEPNEVADSAKPTGTAGGLDNTAAKGPQRVACHAETSHTCRNGHDEHTGNDAC